MNCWDTRGASLSLFLLSSRLHSLRSPRHAALHIFSFQLAWSCIIIVSFIFRFRCNLYKFLSLFVLKWLVGLCYLDATLQFQNLSVSRFYELAIWQRYQEFYYFTTLLPGCSTVLEFHRLTIYYFAILWYATRQTALCHDKQQMKSNTKCRGCRKEHSFFHLSKDPRHRASRRQTPRRALSI